MITAFLVAKAAAIKMPLLTSVLIDSQRVEVDIITGQQLDEQWPKDVANNAQDCTACVCAQDAANCCFVVFM